MKTAVLTSAVVAWMMACSMQEDRRSADEDQTGAYNLVLISIDTLRADHLSCYGYSRNTSPNIDRLAADSVVFLNAYSTAPKTPESHMSMFTSLYPSIHRIFTIMQEEKINVLDEGIATLPELLHANGYTTAGFHGGGFVDAKFGFGRGFDVYRKSRQRRAVSWLRNNGSGNKFFLFYHTYHVHDPYTPAPPFDAMFGSDYNGEIIHDLDVLTKMSKSNKGVALSREFFKRVNKDDPADVQHLIDLYDGEISEMDSELARLFDAVDTYAPRTIIILLSDHGEEFGEHNGGFMHSQVYNETLHVPLIIRIPGGPGGLKIKDRVSLIDVAPTVLEMLGIPSSEQFQGKALFEDGKGRHQRELVFSEFPAKRRFTLLKKDRKVISTERGVEFYNLEKDPAESDDLEHTVESDTDFQQLAVSLKNILAANDVLKEALNKENKQDHLAEETIDRLKALGYIE